MNFLGILEATVASRDTYCRDFSWYGILDTVPGHSCKEEGFLDYLSVPNRAKIPCRWVVLAVIWKYLDGVFDVILALSAPARDGTKFFR